jgi:fatty-acyl-CoA synthase
MRTPLTIGGHLDRAALVYGGRVGLVDEPDPPGGGLGAITYGRMRDLARAQAAALDERGLARGERVAILSQNSGRLLTSFFGVSGWGRVLVPVNFRLSHDEIAYILEHSGASMLLVDEELAELVADLEVKHRLVLGTATDAELFAEGREPEPWDDRTRTPPRRSTTRAAPPPGPRACSSPTETSGPTRRSSGGTPA